MQIVGLPLTFTIEMFENIFFILEIAIRLMKIYLYFTFYPFLSFKA